MQEDKTFSVETDNGYTIIASEIDRHWILNENGSCEWQVYRDNRVKPKIQLFIRRYPNRSLAKEVLAKFLEKPKKGEVIHYRDGNCLNVSRGNLVILSARKLNQRRPRKKRTSHYLGVTFSTDKRKWIAAIAGQYLGVYQSEEIAALAWNLAAVKKYGADSYYNKLDELEFILPEGAEWFPHEDVYGVIK